MPNGYMVVFAVDDSESLVEAERTLIYLKSEDILSKQAVILVANKTDLVRSRVISTNGKKYTMLGVIQKLRRQDWVGRWSAICLRWVT